MRPVVKTNQVSAAASNRRMIVQLLRQSPLSRRKLAELTGLQNSSITYIIRDLLEQGIVRPKGWLDKPGAGKKQELLEINPELGWVVGVGLDNDAASLVFLDAAGGLIDRDRFPIRESAKLLPRALRGRVDSWVTRHGKPAGKLLGVGIGVPGVVDPERGVVLASTRFKTTNWKLGQDVFEAFEARTEIDNDSNFALLAEARRGSGADADTFAFFLFNVSEEGKAYAIHSVGSSLFVEGQLYRGAHFSAGEIDTLIFDDTYGAVTAEQLLLIAKPDGDLTPALEAIADRVAKTLVPVVDLLDPPLLVLGGNLCVSNKKMLSRIEATVNRKIVPVPRRHVEVRPSAFIDHGVSMGAAVAALDSALHANGDTAFPAEAFPVITTAQPYPV